MTLRSSLDRQKPKVTESHAARAFELKCLLGRFSLSNAASPLPSILDIARYDASQLAQPALVGHFNQGPTQRM